VGWQAIIYLSKKTKNKKRQLKLLWVIIINISKTQKGIKIGKK